MNTKVKYNGQLKTPVWYVKHNNQWKIVNVHAKYQGEWYPKPLPEIGDLMVTISPTEAIDAGAQWRRAGTSTWFDSGHTETDINVGNYTIEFKTINGWNDPSNENVTVSDGEISTLTKTYIEDVQYGNLKVYIEPKEARAQRIYSPAPPGRWRREGTGSWKYHGDVEENVPVGQYQIEFNDVVENYSKPSNKSVTIKNEQTAEITGTYTQTSTQWPDLSWLNNKGVNIIQTGGATNHFLWMGQIKNVDNNKGTFEIHADKYGLAFNCDYTEATGDSQDCNNIIATHNPSGSSTTLRIENGRSIYSGQFESDGESSSVEMGIGEYLTSNYMSNKLVEVWGSDSDGNEIHLKCDTVTTLRRDFGDDSIDGDFNIIYYDNVPIFGMYDYTHTSTKSIPFHPDTGFEPNYSTHNISGRVWKSTSVANFWANQGITKLNFYFSTNKNREVWFSDGELWILPTGGNENDFVKIPISFRVNGTSITATTTWGSKTLKFTGVWNIGSNSIKMYYSDDRSLWLEWYIRRIANIFWHKNIRWEGIAATAVDFS